MNLVDYNQVNDSSDNKPKIDNIISMSNNPVKYPLPILTMTLRGVK